MAIDRIPTEDSEQMEVVRFLRIKGIPHHHSPNESSPGNQGKMRSMKMKKMGTSAGFPDLLIFLPVTGIDGEVESYQPIAIEMKRKKGSNTSKEQKLWLNRLELAGIPSYVCKGADEAKEKIQEWIDTIGKGDVVEF